MGSSTDSRLIVRDGRPMVARGEEVIPQTGYRDYILRGDWEERIREFAESGVRTFHLRLPCSVHPGTRAEDFHDQSLWLGPDDYPADDANYPYPLDRQAAHVLEACPDARFYILFAPNVPLSWTRMHPDEMQTDDTGRRYRFPSLASAAYLDGLTRFVRHMVRYCEGKPWGDRIIGYLCLPYGEGCLPMNIAGKMFDCSPASEAGFRAWLTEHYGSDVALREAWRDDVVTLATAAVPRDAEWQAKKRTAQPTIGGVPLDLSTVQTNANEAGGGGLFHWIEPADAAPEHDYCRFMRACCFRWLRTIAGAVKSTARELGRERIFGVDALKQPLMGWQILSMFDGIGEDGSFPNMLVLSGSWDVGEMLDDPDLDLVWNPADYTARPLGYGYESEGVTESMTLRGKIAMIENDARCYVGAGVHDQGAFRTIEEVRAGLTRNAAMVLTRGLQDYWCNVGSSYFHDGPIMREIEKLTAAMHRAQALPHRETRDAVAMVIDDESPLHEDFSSGYQNLACIWQRVRGLAHCGVPYRMLLLSDLKRDNLPAYKTWFFPNLFQIDDDRLALLREKVLRDGNLALFGPATGITDGKHLGADGASRLLGVPMELALRTTARYVVAQDFGHPITRELPAQLVYGDSLQYGPTLVPREWAVEQSGGTPLGHATVCWFLHRTGLFLQERGLGAAGNGRSGARGADDYAMVWSVAMPLPAELFRACARYAGSHVWTDRDDVVFASDNLLAIHSMKAGQTTVRLPGPRRVTDLLTGKPVAAEPVDRLRLRVKPPYTRVFLLEE